MGMKRCRYFHTKMIHLTISYPLKHFPPKAVESFSRKVSSPIPCVENLFNLLDVFYHLDL